MLKMIKYEYTIEDCQLQHDDDELNRHFIDLETIPFY